MELKLHVIVYFPQLLATERRNHLLLKVCVYVHVAYIGDFIIVNGYEKKDHLLKI